MSLFIDTGVFVAFENPKDSHHEGAVRVLEAAADGTWGDVFTSDYVFDEAVTLALTRARSARSAERIGSLILGTGPLGRVTGLLYVSPQIFLRAWSRFLRLAERGLSFTDCTSLELIDAIGIAGIASFDQDFDGLIPRRLDVDEAR